MFGILDISIFLNSQGFQEPKQLDLIKLPITDCDFMFKRLYGGWLFYCPLEAKPVLEKLWNFPLAVL